MAWIKVGDRLPETEGKYTVKTDSNPLPMFVDIVVLEDIPYSIFNGNPIFHLPRGYEIKEWFEEEN
jgi:hypothetical protein